MTLFAAWVSLWTGVAVFYSVRALGRRWIEAAVSLPVVGRMSDDKVWIDGKA